MARPVTAAVFLDRDGVINEKGPEGEYVTDWAHFRFIRGAPEALAELRRRISGVRLIVVTNQRGVATGIVDPTILEAIHFRMCAELAQAGAALDAVFVCPHEIGACDCRKPRTGLFEQAFAAFPEIEPGRSAMIGDSAADAVAGHRFGLATFLVGPRADRRRAANEAKRDGAVIAGEADSLAHLVASGQVVRHTGS